MECHFSGLSLCGLTIYVVTNGEEASLYSQEQRQQQRQPMTGWTNDNRRIGRHHQPNKKKEGVKKDECQSTTRTTVPVAL